MIYKFNKSKLSKLNKINTLLLKKNLALYEYNEDYYEMRLYYISLLYDEVFWKNRVIYLNILEDFISGTTARSQFFSQFIDVRKKDLDVVKLRLDNLDGEINFELNPNARNFNRFIQDLYLLTESLLETMTDPELRVYLKDNFLAELWYYCNEL